MVFCSSFRAESMLGSAGDTRRWLLWEYAGPWPRNIANMDESINALPLALSAELEATLLFVRKHNRSGGEATTGRRTVMLAEGNSIRVVYPHRCDSISAEQIRQGQPLSTPIFLCCTNGKRDQCCAVFGRSLLRSLGQYGQYLWECTHFGGHRFAPTMLALPSGYAYGRLDAAAAETMIECALAGTIFPKNLRGRSGYSAQEQIADGALREVLGPLDVDAVKVHSVHSDLAYCSALGQEYRIDLGYKSFPARPASCGKECSDGSVMVATEVKLV